MLDPNFFHLKKKTGRVNPKIVGLNCIGLLLVLLGNHAYKISDP